MPTRPDKPIATSTVRLVGSKFVGAGLLGRLAKILSELGHVAPHVATKVSEHRTAAMLARYDIVDESDLRDAAKKTGDYLSAPAPEQQAGQHPEFVN